ncbi:hypothetical protein J5H75_25325 [Pseudomonas asiatica]|uniref:hypothetical protein n=1 Tax=Pseudomonas asiatica TaxID=2219225 RepID=UPI001AAFCE4D|nr:hypothetical protein [Pseudomonas asiatica]MBO2924996.1 hypothetical protein [Pseudomonas asiatica]
MIHSLHNARFVQAGGVPGRCVAGYVFSMSSGDDYIRTLPIKAIWQVECELYVEDLAGATYHIVDFEYDECARQVGQMREEIIQGFLHT